MCNRQVCLFCGDSNQWIRDQTPLGTRVKLAKIRNDRAFFELVDFEIDRSRRYGHPMTVAYIGDDFKRINDEF